MPHINLLLGFLSLFVWLALYLLYYREELLPWFINRFTKDKRPQNLKIEDGYYPDGVPIPFRDSYFPSSRPAEHENGERNETEAEAGRESPGHSQPGTGENEGRRQDGPPASRHEGEEHATSRTTENRDQAP